MPAPSPLIQLAVHSIRGDGAVKNYPGLIVFCSLFLSSIAYPQQVKPATPPAPMPPALVTPEVHSDNSVTFRFRAPNAQEVKLTREGRRGLWPCRRMTSGVWTVNTPPLSPDYYGYSIVVDGARSIDPYNPLLKPNLLSTENMVHVQGSAVAALGVERRATRGSSSSLLQVRRGPG